MSTLGSIAISWQRYLREPEPGEHPDAVAHPRIADDVGLHREDEDRTEHRGDRCGAARDEADEERQVPRNPEQRAEQTGLRTDLRVVRLPCPDRRTRARRGLAGVTEAVPLWVVHHRAHAFPQADPVTVDRRLVDAARVAGRARVLLRDVVLQHEILLRPLSLRRDVRE